MNAVYGAQRLQKGEDHRGAAAQPPDGKGALNHAAQSPMQHMRLAERPGRTAQVIRPVSRLFSDFPDMPLGAFRILQAGQFHHAVLLLPIRKADALVDCKARDLSEIVVGMRPDRANPIGCEADPFRVSPINLIKSFFTAHGQLSFPVCRIVFTTLSQRLFECKSCPVSAPERKNPQGGIPAG